MCGRMACALSKASLLHACQYQDAEGRYCNPKWVDLNSHGEYRPSYNISPRNYHPVLLSSVHVPKGVRGSSAHRVMMSPMRWGLVPSWYGGEPQNFIFNTVNCRIESCMDRRSFKGAIAAERRCVVVAEGFFEWKNEQTGKQAYYVYFKQPRGIDMAARTWDGVSDAHDLMRHGHWVGPRLLTMAGIFDVSTSKDVLYSFSILTMDAPRYLQWLHNRVPVILDGEEAVSSWLDPDYSFDELTYSVRCPTSLVQHPVSPVVGKTTNNTVECVLPYYADQEPAKQRVVVAKKHESKSPAKQARRSRSRSSVRSRSAVSSRSSRSSRGGRSRSRASRKRSKSRHRSSGSDRRHRSRQSHGRTSHRHGHSN
ncbi:abasic site processing protein HMCES-like [Amblyomma americanum]